MLTEPPEGVNTWKEEMKRYEMGRTETSWKEQPRPERMNAKIIKERDVRYNPVL